MSTGLLILRIVVGLLLIGHGTQKLFGWFGGYGLEGVGGFFHSVGFRPGKPMAALTGVTEAGAGLFLALGLLTPLAAMAVIGTLLVAASTQWPKVWASQDGFETALLYVTVAVTLAFTGPGRYSLDHNLGIDDTLYGNWWGLAAVVVGAVAAAVVIVRAKGVLKREGAAGPAA